MKIYRGVFMRKTFSKVLRTLKNCVTGLGGADCLLLVRHRKGRYLATTVRAG